MGELLPDLIEPDGSNTVGSACTIEKTQDKAPCSVPADDAIFEEEPTPTAATATSVSLSQTLANSREREIEQLRAANKALTENIVQAEEQLDAMQARTVAMEEAARSRHAEEMQLRLHVRMVSNELRMIERAATEQTVESARKRKSEESLRSERNAKAQQLQQAKSTIQALRAQLQQLQQASVPNATPPVPNATPQSQVKPVRVNAPLPPSQTSQRSMTSPKLPLNSPSPRNAQRVPPIATSGSTLSSFSQDAQDCAVLNCIRNSSNSPLHSPVRSPRRNLTWQTNISQNAREVGSGVTKFAAFIEERRNVKSAADTVRPVPLGDTERLFGGDESIHRSSVQTVEKLERVLNRSLEKRFGDGGDGGLERDAEQVADQKPDKFMNRGLLASQEGRSRHRPGISKGLNLTGSQKSLPQGTDAFAEDHARLMGRQGLALMQGGTERQAELAQISKGLPYSPGGHGSLGRKTRGRASLRSLAPGPAPDDAHDPLTQGNLCSRPTLRMRTFGN